MRIGQGLRRSLLRWRSPEKDKREVQHGLLVVIVQHPENLVERARHPYTYILTLYVAEMFR